MSVHTDGISTSIAYTRSEPFPLVWLLPGTALTLLLFYFLVQLVNNCDDNRAYYRSSLVIELQQLSGNSDPFALPAQTAQVIQTEQDEQVGQTRQAAQIVHTGQTRQAAQIVHTGQTRQAVQIVHTAQTWLEDNALFREPLDKPLHNSIATNSTIQNNSQQPHTSHNKPVSTSTQILPTYTNTVQTASAPALSIAKPTAVKTTLANADSGDSGKNVSNAGNTLTSPPLPDRQWMLIKDFTPSYPLFAKRRMIEGSVTLKLTLNSGGDVEQAQIISSQPENIFDAAALSAAKKWQFTRTSGSASVQLPISMEVVRTVHFNLRAANHN